MMFFRCLLHRMQKHHFILKHRISGENAVKYILVGLAESDLDVGTKIVQVPVFNGKMHCRAPQKMCFI